MLLAVITATPAAAQEVAGVTPPKTLALSGTELMLVGCDAKSKLFIDVYAVALYLQHDGMSQQAVLDAKTPKAVRLYPVYDGKLPDQIPRGWAERLKAKLAPGKYAAVERMYRQFGTHEVATIAYAPGSGTEMMIDGKVVERSSGQELMNGVLGTWLGDGDDIQLLSSGC